MQDYNEDIAGIDVEFGIADFVTIESMGYRHMGRAFDESPDEEDTKISTITNAPTSCIAPELDIKKGALHMVSSKERTPPPMEANSTDVRKKDDACEISC